MTLLYLTLLILVVSVRYFLFLQSRDLLRMELLVPMARTHLYDGQACHFLRMSRAVFLCNIHLSVKYKLQVSLLFMEQDLMVLFCEAFSPVIFVLVSVQMKYFPMKYLLLSCLSYFASKMNQFLSCVPSWFKEALISVLTACLEDVWCRDTYAFLVHLIFGIMKCEVFRGFVSSYGE